MLLWSTSMLSNRFVPARALLICASDRLGVASSHWCDVSKFIDLDEKFERDFLGDSTKREVLSSRSAFCRAFDDLWGSAINDFDRCGELNGSISNIFIFDNINEL
ncbi:unnamed protein product [Rotaria sordida]|uniref:Uncharacterized protein n=1 Tax=Rotaria sordida TaxID=392033 RepID=A0A814R560_9BILA|nr:unnamed protein product [Rotaria sordida]CAF0957421.1 unnamed protein product [Rotaria sordida]CAF1127223.1 unnamed protein product [Rotaria sordida]CAF1224501.1 unnamed protein product [Rotaria sordida]CAF1251983.1 unnamed protein product [Rotaria sordida]